MSDVRTLLSNLLGHSGDPSQQFNAIRRVVLDLLMEVEALRKAVAELSARSATTEGEEITLDGVGHALPGPQSVYASAYADTAWLTHWSAGTSDGWEKLLVEFYGRGRTDDDWRECILLRRLGVTEEGIAKYRQNASDAELCT